MQSFGLNPSDAKTTIMSTLKALGPKNPMAIPFIDENIENGVSMEVKGGKIVNIT